MMEEDWRSTTLTRHVLIVETPDDRSSPGRGDIESGWLSNSDPTVSDVVTFTRKGEVNYEGDLPVVRSEEPWKRNDGIWGWHDIPEMEIVGDVQEYAMRQRMIEAMKETIRLLEADMPRLPEKVTGYTPRKKEPNTLKRYT